MTGRPAVPLLTNRQPPIGLDTLGSIGMMMFGAAISALGAASVYYLLLPRLLSRPGSTTPCPPVLCGCTCECPQH
jgi:hypothetical protein